ncbi:carbonic anhydrase domain-containing protein [Ditylenchus destructor]|uniref:Carbonic anhydrase n=1 Tax=Ditylenchus destructor TaxID=166010 RepID=A0AAD4NI82_9BILA|nr:carbonic anhydrase domain-containing protein [Ditylenchus destructor]
MAGLKKVLEGILRYRQTVRKDLVKQFEKVRDNPDPSAVFFTCMDSRILPARFTQAQVGDMFVVRNSGNMIPDANYYGVSGYEVSVTTEPAALELAVKRGKIRYVIVCGHSDCKAINTLYNLHQCPNAFDPESPMDHWLRRHGYQSVKKLEERLQSGQNKVEFSSANSLLRFSALIDPENKYNVEDKLSQINTLQQLTNVASHGFLREFLENGLVHLHAFWFDIYTGNMFMFSHDKESFVMIDEDTVPRLLEEERMRYCGKTRKMVPLSKSE